MKANHDVAERKKLRKFGDASRDGAGPNPSTTSLSDKITLHLVQDAKSLDADVDEEKDVKKELAKVAKIQCRNCKGDHWTSKCPYKDSVPPLEETKAPSPMPATDGTHFLSDRELTRIEATSGPSTFGGKYVPPSMRNREGGPGPAGESMRDRRDDLPTIRISNLTEEATENDMYNLFSRFGKISRCSVPKDKDSGRGRGFAFIAFYEQDDAERAASKMNGYGFDNLILKVEMSGPRPPR